VERPFTTIEDQIKKLDTATYTANITSSEGSIEFKLGGNLTFVVATED
jgi:hypothetical protein